MLAKEQLLKKMESSLTALSSKQMDLEASQASLETRMVQGRQLIAKLRMVVLYREADNTNQNKEVNNSKKCQ